MVPFFFPTSLDRAFCLPFFHRWCGCNVHCITRAQMQPMSHLSSTGMQAGPPILSWRCSKLLIIIPNQKCAVLKSPAIFAARMLLAHIACVACASFIKPSCLSPLNSIQCFAAGGDCRMFPGQLAVGERGMLLVLHSCTSCHPAVTAPTAAS
jgi:hypothetical protein